MTCNQIAGGYFVSARKYHLEVSEKSFSVFLRKVLIARLSPISALDTLVGDEKISDIDDASLTFEAKVDIDGGNPIFTWTTKSNLWTKKVYTLTCREDNFSYKVKVEGKGSLFVLDYFKGLEKDPENYSSYEFCEGFIPMAHETHLDHGRFYPTDNFEFYSTLMIPHLFCYSFRTEGLSERLGLGLVAKPGEYNFHRFNYKGGEFSKHCFFSLWVDYDGMTKIDGEWESPEILGLCGKNDNDIFKQYSDYHFSSGILPEKKAASVPRFWLGPIACGWLEQNARAEGTETPLFHLANEPLYNDLVAKLDGKGLSPKILIIDDKWQENYGTAIPDKNKWPNLRGFIDRMHDKGIKVFLWFKLWDAEGLSDDMCIFDGDGIRTVDPTNPKYVEFLRERIKNLVSDKEGGYNCDGFKLDFAFLIPKGYKAVSYGGQYGSELLKTLFTVIRDAAKEEKSDVCINCSPCHPYYADICDHARIHDYDFRNRNICEEMKFRADMYKIALPNTLIDTDGAGFASHRDTMRYMRFAPKLGIPDLYQVSDNLALTLSDEDWAEVRDIWSKYEKKADKEYKK